MERKAWIVYLLRCSDGSLYTGITNDLDRRLVSHNSGKASRYTRSRLPVKVVHTQPVRGRSAALRLEIRIKRLSRAEKVALIRQGPASAGVPAPPPAIRGSKRSNRRSTSS